LTKSNSARLKQTFKYRLPKNVDSESYILP
jgi:hypothetical protein